MIQNPETAEASEGNRPGLAASAAVALAVSVAAALLAAAALFGSAEATWQALDFNAAPFEDFLGPYWQTARSLDAGQTEPAAGYVYPATLAWLLTPVIALGADGPIAASTLGALMVLGSLGLFLAAAFALAPPSRLSHASAAGAVLGLSHAALHGAYWAQASLPAIALTAGAVALRQRSRPGLAGAALGLAAAIKLYPAVAALVFLVPERRPRALTAFLTVFAGTAILGPIALMGVEGFVSFHRAVSADLSKLSGWVFTADAGSGSQDLPTVLLRALDFTVPGAALRVAGVLCGALLIAGAARTLARGGPHAALRAVVYLAAVPWTAVSPTWPHGLLWVPLGWWCAAHSVSWLARILALGSFAAGSIFALALAGSPAGYVDPALPAWSAMLCVLAVVVSGAAAASGAADDSDRSNNASAYAASP
ncbi:MAG: glycosyltransferase family 87 protein [Planctomycetota bacterium]